MIINTLKSTTNVMVDSMRVTNDKQAAKIFKEQVLALGVCTPMLDQLINIAGALKEKKIVENIFTLELKETLQTAVDNCGEKTNDHTLDTSTVQVLKSAIELFRGRMETSWINAVDKQCSNVVDSLKSLKSLLSDKKEAEELIEILDKTKVTLPSSSKGIDDFLSKVNRGKEIIDELNLNTEVEKFINKVKLQKATVGDLTPTVLEWLKDNNLMNKMKVRF